MKTFILGLIVVLGAVGGTEASTTTTTLIQSIVIACVGLSIMLIGVSNIHSSN
jgi:uncharacterized membrane protein YqgA involved in biofilm formation